MSNDTPATDPWAKLRAATPARIGLGRAGSAQHTTDQMAFQFAHARARDAVHRALDTESVAAALAPLEVINVHSAAPDRATYLRRPDLGRRLADRDWPELDTGTPPDVVFIIADGLSSDAAQTHAAAVIKETLPLLEGLTVGPVVIATQARVAIGDQIGDRLGARLSVLLVGERPGLTVANSLGAYLTYGPRPGRMDSERNCISNIHNHGGLSYALGASKIAWLIRAALQLELTGTGLKENSATAAIPGEISFLPNK